MKVTETLHFHHGMDGLSVQSSVVRLNEVLVEDTSHKINVIVGNVSYLVEVGYKPRDDVRREFSMKGGEVGGIIVLHKVV